MLASIHNFARRLLVPLAALLLAMLSSQVAAVAAADAPQQVAQQRSVESRVESRSDSVVKMQLLAVDGSTYTGTGVYVTGLDGRLYLMTADHVLRDHEGRFGKKLLLRPFNADDDSGWMEITDVADSVQRSRELDLAVFRLTAPLPGMTPAEVCTTPARAGQRIFAYGFSSSEGRVMLGEIRGRDADGMRLAARLGARSGDSGGPVFDLQSGKLIGIISSNAETKMTEGFTCKIGPDGDAVAKWPSDGQPLHADTLIIHLAAIAGK